MKDIPTRRIRSRTGATGSLCVRAGLTVLMFSMGWTLLGCDARTPARELSPAQAVLRWQARNETGIYGYLVFRAEHPEGPFLRLNREIIHVATEGAGPGSYEFVDREVERGRTYYYSLDMVRNNGQKRRFSDVMSKTVSP